MKIRSIYLLLSILPIIGSFFSCAQQGSPTGGPEDVTPPVVVNAAPENYSINFDAKRIEITFDEFIDMANFTQELVVSPPMAEKPLIKLRNKTLVIEFEEQLRDTATYTFNFGQGIKDLNEGNIFMNYEYVFATGSELDSLSIKGTLKNANDLTIPESPIFVMLYNDFYDSIPYLDIPFYVGRTDNEGNFAVNNIRAGSYKLFVIKDGNNNFLFDQPNEQIAFLDSTLLADPSLFREMLMESGAYDTAMAAIDSLKLTIDTTGMSVDSIQFLLDSLELRKEELLPDFNSLFVDLFMFTEASKNQYISEYNRDNRTALDLLFNLPTTDSFRYEVILREDQEPFALLPEFGLKRDSVKFWMPDTLSASYDSIMMAFQYTVFDSLEMPELRFDTIDFVFREKTEKKTKAEEKDQPESLALRTVRNNGSQDYFRPLAITLDEPLKTIDKNFWEFYTKEDTLFHPTPLKLFHDSSNIRRFYLEAEWEQEGVYRIQILPKGVTSIYEKQNDTTEINFKIRPVSEYGVINLTLEGVEETLLVELYNGERLIKVQSVNTSGPITFTNLMPATYRIRFVHDKNSSGEWDTGKYLEKRQPERVEYLFRDVEVRANWDHDISYVMGSNDAPPSKAKGENDDTAEEEQPLFR